MKTASVINSCLQCQCSWLVGGGVDLRSTSTNLYRQTHQWPQLDRRGGTT